MTFLKTYYDGYQNEFFKSEIIGMVQILKKNI